MTIREYYVQRREAELPVFMEVFKALPEGELDYKPADKSPTAKEIAWIMTRQLKSCIEIVANGKTEWEESEAPSWDQVLEKFETWSNELTERASRMSDDDWNRKAEFYYQGKMMRNDPVGPFLWAMLFDEIHHRGQLSAYLRPMGGTVPAIYGPSADAKPKSMAMIS
jgi:uncharacterized damage-inducible protein DinB